MMSTIGVTGPQRLVIRLVGQTPGQTASNIASMLGKHPSTLTGVLARSRSAVSSCANPIRKIPPRPLHADRRR